MDTSSLCLCLSCDQEYPAWLTLVPSLPREIKPFDHERTNQSQTKLQDQFPGEPPSTFFKLLLQVCAKPVNNHEPIPGRHKEYFFSTSECYYYSIINANFSRAIVSSIWASTQAANKGYLSFVPSLTQVQTPVEKHLFFLCIPQITINQ